MRRITKILCGLFVGAIVCAGIEVPAAIAQTPTATAHESHGEIPRPEGDYVVFEVRLDQPVPGGQGDPPLEVMVRLSETGDMITGEGDHTLVIAPGSNVAYLDVDAQDDEVTETNSTVRFEILTGTGYQIGTPASASVELTDNDVPPTATAHEVFDGSSRQEGDFVSFEIRLDKPVPWSEGAPPLVVNFSLSETGDMIAGEGTHTLTIDPGYDFAFLDVDAQDDNVSETNSTASFVILSGTGYEIGSPASASVEFTDNDVERTVIGLAARRDGADVVLTVSRDGPTRDALQLTLEIFSDSLAFASRQVAVTIPAGSSSESLRYQITNIEYDGYVDAYVMWGSDPNVDYYNGYVFLTVEANPDTTPTVRFGQSTATIVEGGSAQFVVERDRVNGSSMTVNYQLVPSEAVELVASDAVEIVSPSLARGSVTIPAGSASATVDVQTVDNSVINEPGTITGRIVTGNGYDPGNGTHVVTVEDNDIPTVTLTKTTSASTITEGGSIGFRVERAVAVATALDVLLIIQQDADVLSEESKALDSVTIPAHGRSATFTVHTVDDTEDEVASRFQVSLDDDPSQEFTILVNDNDSQTVEILPLTVESLPEGAVVDFQLSRTGPDYSTALTVVVRVEKKGSIFGGTSSQEISVDFSQGELFVYGRFTIPTNTVVDGVPGEFRFKIKSSSAYLLGETAETAWVSIVDDDHELVSWSDTNATPTSVREGASATIRVKRNSTGNTPPNASISSLTTGAWPVSGEACHPVRFTGSATETTVRIPIPDDSYDLDDVAMEVWVHQNGGCSHLDGRATPRTIQVIDNDSLNNPPQVSITRIGSGPIIETQSARFRISRTGSTARPLDVTYQLDETSTELYLDGTPIRDGHGNVLGINLRNWTRGCEESRACGTVSFAAGESHKDIEIATRHNLNSSNDSIISVFLLDEYAPLYWAGQKDSLAWIEHPSLSTEQTVRVNDNTSLLADKMQLTVRGNVTSVTEGGTLSLRLTRTGPANAIFPAMDVPLDFAQTGGQNINTGEISSRMAVGQAVLDIDIPIPDDMEAKADGNITVTLEDHATYDIVGTASFSIDILDNEPYIRVDQSAAFEVDEGQKAVLNLTLVQGAPTESYTLDWRTKGIGNTTVATPNVDYTADPVANDGTFNRITLNSGASAAKIEVQVLEDDATDDDEVFGILLKSLASQNANLVPPLRLADGTFAGTEQQFQVTINQVDPTHPYWTITPHPGNNNDNSIRYTEINEGFSQTFTVELHNHADLSGVQKLRVMTASCAGLSGTIGTMCTATAGEDYTVFDTELQFDLDAATPVTTQTINVAVLDDSADDDDERFLVKFIPVTGSEYRFHEATGPTTEQIFPIRIRTYQPYWTITPYPGYNNQNFIRYTSINEGSSQTFTVELHNHANLSGVQKLQVMTASCAGLSGTIGSRCTATAGDDYTVIDTELQFDLDAATPVTTRTVDVVIHNDSQNDDDERFVVKFIPVTGFEYRFHEVAGPTTEQIFPIRARNDGPLPKAWLARFGRTVAEQAIEAVETRFDTWREAGFAGTLGGQPLGGGAPSEALTPEEDAEGGLGALSGWFRGETDKEDGAYGFGEHSMTERDLLASSSFSMTQGTAETGFASFWGRGAVTRFDGRDGALDVDGEVSSAMLGADWSRDALVAGLMLSRSRGEGGYRDGSGSGTVESTLTALFPYARYALSERLSVWGMTGYGEGTLTLTPTLTRTAGDGTTLRVVGTPLRPDLGFAMGALGLRSVLVDGGADGATLAATSDGFVVRTVTDTVSGPGGNLEGVDAHVTRVRLALEGSRPINLGETAVLIPSLELGVRHDGGDAETGFGADIGAGLALVDPSRGLSTELRARGLLTHEDDGLSERGLSGTFAFDPAPGSERGLSLSLTQTVGAQASGGANALLERTTLAGLGTGDDGLAARRLDARLGYGFALLDDRYTATPEIGLGLSDADREFRTGWRLAERVSSGFAFEFGLEGTRREFIGAGTGVEHGLVAGAGWRLVTPGAESLELRIEGTLREAAKDGAPTEAGVGLRLGVSW